MIDEEGKKTDYEVKISESTDADSVGYINFFGDVIECDGSCMRYDYRYGDGFILVLKDAIDTDQLRYKTVTKEEYNAVMNKEIAISKFMNNKYPIFCLCRSCYS